MDSKADSSCPECEGWLDESDRETICSDCGLVVAERWIDTGPEWRSFEDDRNRKRTGAPLTRSRHDRGLSTRIGHEGSEVRLTGRKRRRVARMRRQHRRAQFTSKAQRNQVDVFVEIRRIVSALSLPTTVRDQACDLFRSAQNENLVRGRSLEGFAAATIYATCRTLEIPRTVEEVTAEANASESELKAAYDALNRELGLPVGPIDPREYLPRFASKLSLPARIEFRAGELVGDAYDAGIVGGRNPCGVAGACLYAAAREGRASVTQHAVADIAGVTPVTLRTTYHALRDQGLVRG